MSMDHRPMNMTALKMMVKMVQPLILKRIEQAGGAPKRDGHRRHPAG
jgi:hypothetical protein